MRPGVPTQGPVGPIVNAPSAEEAGTEYSADGAGDLGGSLTQEPKLRAPKTSQAVKPKPAASS